MTFRQSIVNLLCYCCCLLLSASECLGLGNAVGAVNADFMWTQGYTGDGIEIGVIDLHQADPSHPAIASNYLGSVNFANGAGWLAFHATGVTGSAVSQDPTRKGVAHGAGWWTGQTTNRVGRTPNQDAMTVSAETFAQGLGILNGNPAEVITLSIGIGGSDTATDQWSLALDHIVGTLGTTVVVAAGNSGPLAGSLSGAPVAAYNILSVGATGGSGNFVSEDYTQIAPYSSRGMTSDGRSKPDIVAPGSLIEMPTVGGDWVVANGTSFAAPIVAGGATLLIDMGLDRGYDTDAKVIKSVLMNSADKLPGWSHTSTSPLDPNFGAGQMNLESAYYQYDAGEQEVGMVSTLGWDHGVLSGSVSNTYEFLSLIPSGAGLSATLTWNRDVTTDVEDIESATYTESALENLELFLFDTSDLLTPIASSISTVDNVEHLFLSTPATGNYLLEVRSASGVVMSPQSYSLAWDVEIPLGLAGDYNADGTVDAADYTAWRDNVGAIAGTLPNDVDGGVINSAQYDTWIANFGVTAAPATAVPESGGALLGMLGLVGVSFRRKSY